MKTLPNCASFPGAYNKVPAVFSKIRQISELSHRIAKEKSNYFEGELDNILIKKQ